jgi:hypothetical protein
MKTLNINTKEMARATVTRVWTIRRALLACGVVSSLFYVVTLSLGAMRWEGYSATSQAISELFAIGAPTRSFIATLLVVYALLIYAFGLGIWQSDSADRVLRVAAVLIIGKEVFGLVATVITPCISGGWKGTFQIRSMQPLRLLASFSACSRQWYLGLWHLESASESSQS